MRSALLIVLALAAGSCAAPRPVQRAPGATAPGLPESPPQPAAASRDASPPTPVVLPERIDVAATYRLVLVEGRFVLVREPDGAALAADPSLAPALLPPEIAAELASDRESAARMDNALESVMSRSRELSQRAAELQAQSARLAEELAAQQAKAAAPRPAAAAPPPDPAPPN